MNRTSLVFLGVLSVHAVASDALLDATYQDDLPAAKALIEKGENVNEANRHGVTALSLACRNGNAEMVSMLLEAGADAKGELAGGETFLMTASRTGTVECVEALISRGARVDAAERGSGRVFVRERCGFQEEARFGIYPTVICREAGSWRSREASDRGGG
jgi:ankyrin repeat protein